MLKLDNSLLDELGLGGLPEDQKRAMLHHIYDTLELRVGTNLANQMTDRQLEEFERFIDNGGDANQAQALQWLETNLPNYKQVVNDVFEALKVEIKQMAPQIMAASIPAQAQQQVAAAPQYAQQQPAQDPMQPTPQYQPSDVQVDSASISAQQANYQGQFPQQQPPAGPGGYQPYSVDDQQAS